jgi:UDPglucose 6-dehydrogenase
MDIAVIGAGYVGLVTAAGLASLGHRVRVGEADTARVAMLNAGGVPLYEDGLDALLAEGIASGGLTFHTDNDVAVQNATVVMLALPTPPAADGSADLSYIEGALEGLAGALGDDCIVVTKSTVPVGSAEQFSSLLEGLGVEVSVASNPEFLREGSAVRDFFHPDRIVIGTDDSDAAETMTRMYADIDAPVIVADARSAEMIKYASNAYLATRLTFANTLANVCEYVGADVTAVLDGVGADRRIGSHFLKPGPGYGGSCFPKDTLALVSIAQDAGYDFALMRGVIEANDAQMAHTVGKIITATKAIDQPKVALWGLAFKAGTDDTRHSPAVSIAEGLMAAGHTVTAFDPAVTQPPTEGIRIAPSALDAARDADVLVIATEWPEFTDVGLESVRDAMRGTAIVDARNLLDPATVTDLGMSYTGIGR